MASTRSFTKSGQTVMATSDATATWLLSQGWTETGSALITPTITVEPSLSDLAREHLLGHELIPNRDLRDWAGSLDTPLGWSGFWQSGKLELARDTTTWRTGGSSWRTRVDTGGLQRLGTSMFRLEPGTDYTVTALIRTEDASICHVDILFMSSDGVTEADFFAPDVAQQGGSALTVPVSNEWVEVSQTFTVPAGHRRGKIYVNLGTSAGPLTNWLDSASVRGGRQLGLDVSPGWITPALGGSWLAYGGEYGTAQYKKVRGVVYMRGLIKSGTSPSTLFTLPAAYRPSSSTNEGTHVFTCTANAGAARIDVRGADGAVIMNGYQAAGDNGWISLANVQFPADA